MPSMTNRFWITPSDYRFASGEFRMQAYGFDSSSAVNALDPIGSMVVTEERYCCDSCDGCFQDDDCEFPEIVDYRYLAGNNLTVRTDITRYSLGDRRAFSLFTGSVPGPLRSDRLEELNVLRLVGRGTP